VVVGEGLSVLKLRAIGGAWAVGGLARGPTNYNNPKSRKKQQPPRLRSGLNAQPRVAEGRSMVESRRRVRLQFMYDQHYTQN